ncbi:MAG: hypothetical protein FWF00_07130 [Endomicrobia bacterium]|nr:hypothetical protein [Endomicrobiia bacterium]MCL2507439.1 hypothetical protein [Endomicrobiia bacterium]
MKFIKLSYVCAVFIFITLICSCGGRGTLYEVKYEIAGTTSSVDIVIEVDGETYEYNDIDLPFQKTFNVLRKGRSAVVLDIYKNNYGTAMATIYIDKDPACSAIYESGRMGYTRLETVIGY